MKNNPKAITITFTCRECQSVITTNVLSKKEETDIMCPGCGQVYKLNLMMVIKKGK